MNTTPLKPRKSLNKAYLKVKPNRSDIEAFKSHLTDLIDRTNDTESEEFHKNLVSSFLKKTYYEPQHFINTKGRNDLVIHNGKNATSPVGVIIEAKKPTNKTGMLSRENLNKKALHELLLYYLRERITQKNLNVKYLIATNIHEWFIFDATVFDKLFAQNKALVKQFEDFENGRLSSSNTDFFYKEIAQPFIESIKEPIAFTYFDIHQYEKPLRNQDKKDDRKLIALYKLLSPEHLLKLPFSNDSNSLDKKFYAELLHIIGLQETKVKGKKIIERKPTEERNGGALLENAINIINERDRIYDIEKPSQFGTTLAEQQYNIALELCITWVNRILFLKLLESQLITYHKGDKAYAFLNHDTIPNNDALDKLFFSVLARKPAARNERIKEKFAKVPYLNSSLFEPTELERKVLEINQLDENIPLPVWDKTVLKDSQGKKQKGDMQALEYFFAFLEAYDFSSEGAEDIQEDNKTLINASVLGLIFEKINGYKDGSFFTPGFITMYMCRETIRRAVVQKFNDTKDWTCENLDDLYDNIEDRSEANEIVNSIKICDPAVGSGHFLVSALNEVLAVKNDLKILQDRSGKRLKEYQFEVENDELVVTDEDGALFEYVHTSPETQRVQEALFHEKQTIIENCLFGVDINPNSVKICRLRLWIELLKNAYYKTPTELETLPNIDINIKCGNSLISRFDLEADISKALKKSKWTIDSYRLAVDSYRNAQSKEEKHEMERLIQDIKSDFRSEISKNDPKAKKLYKMSGELTNLTMQQGLFEMGKREKAAWKKKVASLNKQTQKLEQEIEEIKNNKIYENAFEWRFEFPEVLNDEGDFVGFDVVIGNPPYIRQEEFKEYKTHFKESFSTYSGTADMYVFFIERAFDIMRSEAYFTYIMPNKFMQAGYGKQARRFLLENDLISIIDFGDLQVFEEATTYPCILIAKKSSPTSTFSSITVATLNYPDGFLSYLSFNKGEIKQKYLSDNTWVISSERDQTLIQKVKLKSKSLVAFTGLMGKYGIKTGLTEAFVIDEDLAQDLIQKNPKCKDHIHPFLLGRDVKPYRSAKPTKYLIKFQKGFTLKNGGDQPEEWFETEFPGIFTHLQPYKEKARKRTDKGDFYWELRACDYYEKFTEPKIMYQVFQVKPCFIYDNEGLFCNNSMWILPTSDKVLLAILNSKIGWWLISKYCTQIQNGYQLIWKYFSQIPIALASESLSIAITEKVTQILALKKENPEANTSALKAEIDQLVYQLYDLTDEEIQVVEESVK